MSERKLYSGHQAIEVVELMGMLAAQYNIHSETEALAIARKGAELLRDQQDEIKALALKLDRYRWIPVDERLPPDEMSVLAFKSNGHVDKTCRYAGGWLLPSLEPHVTHWMPLPEPPK